MKKILCLILLVLFAVGCATMQPEQIEDLKEKILKANSDVNSFKFKSTNKALIETVNMTMKMDMEMEGAMDRSAKKMMVKGEMKMDDQSMPLETYSDGQFVYANNMGQWVKVKLEQDMFESQDQAKFFIDFMEQSEIEAEEAVFDNKPVYKIKVIPDKDALLDLAQQNAPLPMQEQGMLEDLFKDMQIIYYVDKDSFIAENAEIRYEIAIEDLVMKNDMTFQMYDINKPVDVVIPEAAKDAVDLAKLQEQMAEEMTQDLPDLEELEAIEIEE